MKQMTLLEYQYPIPRHKDRQRAEDWIDDWHYCAEELPEVQDIYYCIELYKDTYIYRYLAYARNKWWYWDSYFSKFMESKIEVLAWVQIPGLYRKVDKYLHQMYGMDGIIN